MQIQEPLENDFDFEEIISQANPTHKIEELDLESLKDFSQRFRITMAKKSSIKDNDKQSQQTKQFLGFIVKLINMIQPSKLIFSKMLDTLQDMTEKYYPQDSKIEMRKAAKEKNILVINRLTLDQEKQLVVKVQENLEHLKRCLLLRQSQLGMVLFIEDNLKSQDREVFLQEYGKSYDELKQFAIPKQFTTRPINYFIISNILQKQYGFLQDFSTKCQQLNKYVQKYQELLKDGKVVKSDSRINIENTLKKLKIISAKVQTIADLFPFACIKSTQDLFSFEKTHNRWKKLFDEGVIGYKIYGESKKVRQSFESLKASLNIVNAAMNIMSRSGQTPIKNMAGMFSSVSRVFQVAVNKNAAKDQAQVMIAEPSQKLAKQIWNLPERKQFKAFIEMALPSIEFSIQFFIPRITKQYFQQRLNTYKQIPLPNFEIGNLATYFKEMISKQKIENKVSIRINNYFTLALKEFKEEVPRKKGYIEEKMTKYSKTIMTTVSDLKNKYVGTSWHPHPKSVIFHIHGGGFISMSSFIHQTYTRNWANNLQVPIVSVDYGKAPQHPFPQGLMDCFQAYLWTLNTMRQIYQFQPQKVILVGDSAGGNLVASLLNLLISWNIRQPDGIVMVYPALNLNYYDFSPSLLTSLNDMILPHTFLKICLNSYLKDPRYKPDEDPLVSPILTSYDMLKKYPQTRIFVGSKDPFHDDCCRFAQRLNLCKPGDVKLTVFQEFPHGFLQFDMKHQPQYYCQQALKEVESALSELLAL